MASVLGDQEASLRTPGRYDVRPETAVESSVMETLSNSASGSSFTAPATTFASDSVSVAGIQGPYSVSLNPNVTNHTNKPKVNVTRHFGV